MSPTKSKVSEATTKSTKTKRTSTGMSKLMVLKPLLSEKSFALSKAQRTYVFGVPTSANKLTVAEAVQSQFNVGVQGVKVANVKGKTKRTVRSGKSIQGQRINSKKAYVTLDDGDSLPIFDEEVKAEDLPF